MTQPLSIEQHLELARDLNNIHTELRAMADMTRKTPICSNAGPVFVRIFEALGLLRVALGADARRQFGKSCVLHCFDNDQLAKAQAALDEGRNRALAIIQDSSGLV